MVQGDAYSLKRLLENILPAARGRRGSGLPLLTKPLRTRLRLINDVFGLMPGCAVRAVHLCDDTPPIPKGLARVETEASERIWLNLPPARVWVYRRA